MNPAEDNAPSAPEGHPKTLDRIARRVLGVLVEKAKTTPDSYPMTVSALINGCNQKSNRSPQMNLDEDDVIGALDRLRDVGAAREIQGSGRVNKYRHAAYEWLDVNSAQAAVMVELMLRGPQTAGELRARASRMESMPDLAAVQQTLAELGEKGLARPLTPPGRGQQFAHMLYEPHEVDKLEASVGGVPPTSIQQAAPGSSTSTAAGPANADTTSEIAELRQLVLQLQQRLTRIENELGMQADA